MKLEQYLAGFPDSDRVFLVGPLYQGIADMREPVVLVDGGSNYRHGNSGFAIGDGDSARDQLDQFLNPDKDYSDLAYVLRHLSDRFRQIHLCGFLGARRDHELFNLGEVHHFLAGTGKAVTVLFDNSITAYSAGDWEFDLDGTFSLAVIEHTAVTLTGRCQYQIPRPTVVPPLSSFGLSNRGYGRIQLHTEGPAFVIRESRHA